jgi:hypothetical protein
MSRPSDKASQLAEELVDYVRPHMSRAAAIVEMASLVDDMNSELIEVIESLLEQAKRIGPGQHALLLNHLDEVMQTYRPLRLNPESQHELFEASTTTITPVTKVSAKAPAIRPQKV